MINKIISADDLFWCEEEKKYISLSQEEIDKIIATCIDQNITSLEEIYKIMQWAGAMRVGNLLLNNFMKNSIKIIGLDENNEPIFGEKKDDFE